MEFVPFGSEDKIKLSVAIVRNLVAEPTKTGELPEERECMRFMMLCRSRRLNPFEGDAFLIGFFDNQLGRTRWNLITAHQTFTKRAEQHPEYNGKESGIIVWPPIRCRPCDGDGKIKDDTGKIQVCPVCHGKGATDEIEGDFLPEADADGNELRLVGGWCKVYYKTRSIPEHQRLKLSTYNKGFGVWKNDPAGMICKCAEAAALRSAFPTVLGGLFLREEFRAQTDEPAAIRAPDFTPALAAPAAPAPAPVPAPVVEAEVDEPPPGEEPPPPGYPRFHPPEVTPPPPKPAAPVPPSKQLRTMLSAAKVKEAELIDYLQASGTIPQDVNSLEEIQLTAPNVLGLIIEQWSDVRAKLLAARGK